MKKIINLLTGLFNRSRKREQKYNTPPSAYTPLTHKVDLPEGLPAWVYEPIPEPALINPYKHYKNWYKGQIHVHTNYDPSIWVLGDDGKQEPKQVLEAYRDKGYAFISLTAHNLIVPTPNNLDVEGIINISGIESGYGCRHHMLGVGVKTEGFNRDRIKNTCYCDEIQPRINYLFGKGGIVIVAHPGSGHDGGWPHWSCDGGWSRDCVRTSYGYHGIEVFNRSLDARNLWDELLCDGRRTLGFGVDDCHNTHVKNHSSFNRSWIVVNSDKEKTDADFGQDIVTNIRTGNFYTVLRSFDVTGSQDTSSSGTDDFGPKLDIHIQGNEVIVNTDTDKQSVVYFIWGKIGSSVQVWQDIKFAYSDNNYTATFSLEGTEDWARVEIRQKRCGELYLALSQPLFPLIIVT